MIKLRLLTENDLPFLLEVRNDESTRVNLENNSIFTLEQCQGWFDSLTSPWYIIKVNRQKVGYIRTSEDEIGCDIHPNFRRKGYARIAYEIYLKDKDYVTLWVFLDNFAIDLYSKLGFKPTGEHKNIRGRGYIKMEYKK
tara:strand:+ start:10 stop:426 length:417 start_codon:yes stop_codon:yes gene_type:complete